MSAGPATSRAPGRARAPRALRLAAWLGGGVLTMFTVCAVALWIYAGPAQQSSLHTIAIEPGTAAKIAAGANPLELPATWELISGDVLVIINDDDLTHTLGSWAVPAGSRLETVLRPGLAPLLCTLHPDGQITLDVHPARTDWLLPLQASLLLGLPLGAVGAAVSRVLRSLDDPPEPGATRPNKPTATAVAVHSP